MHFRRASRRNWTIEKVLSKQDEEGPGHKWCNTRYEGQDVGWSGVEMLFRCADGVQMERERDLGIGWDGMGLGGAKVGE